MGASRRGGCESLDKLRAGSVAPLWGASRVPHVREEGGNKGPRRGDIIMPRSVTRWRIGVMGKQWGLAKVSVFVGATEENGRILRCKWLKRAGSAASTVKPAAGRMNGTSARSVGGAMVREAALVGVFACRAPGSKRCLVMC
jgi:hypothetical protein